MRTRIGSIVISLIALTLQSRAWCVPKDGSPKTMSSPPSGDTDSAQGSPTSGLRSGSFLPFDPFHAGVTIGSGVGWLTEGAAASQGLGKTGPTVHLGVFADVFDLLTGAVSFGTIFVKDKSSFNQGVMDMMGNTFDASSSVNLTIVGLSAGLRSPDFCLHLEEDGKGWLATNAYARFGHAWVSGSRSIDKCTDCSSQSLSLDGGSFVESGVNVGIKQGDGIGLFFLAGYRRYMAGASTAGEIQLDLGLSYW